MSVTLYGIPNCDTVKKARTWLDGRGIAYAFHDYKKAGADAGKLAEWCAAAGWDKVLNRAGHDFQEAARCRQGRSRRGQGGGADGGQPVLHQAPHR